MDRSQTISHALKSFAFFISHIELKSVADAVVAITAAVAFHLDCLHIYVWLCVCQILHFVRMHFSFSIRLR